jgi:rubrerythrin
MEDTKWPYQQGVLKNMETIRCEGLTKWLERQDKRWRCANCGASHSWWDETCPQCGQTVANYQADL